jgi:DNA (cytosine-5)-methyltransferase 1
MLDVLDLFSGIGGFSLGLESTGGYRTRAFCEIEPYCRAVLQRHWPGVPVYDDVRTLTGEQLRAAGIIPDVIVGGFPCQDISLAGRGAGIEGARSSLWSEYARLVAELRPDWVVVENSPGLRLRGADRLLGDLEACGYAGWPVVVGACHAGAPHLRRRAWVVAHANHPRLEKPVPGEEGELTSALGTHPWSGRSPVDRVAYGVPHRVDRIVALGNAVVPQVAALIGRAILEVKL